MKLRNRKGKRIPFFVKWAIRTALENFVPYLRNKIFEVSVIKKDVREWLALQLSIVEAIIFAVLDLNDVGLTLNDRLLMVFDAYYGKEFPAKANRNLFGKPLTWWSNFITRAALSFVEPYLLRKIKESGIQRDDVKAWLSVQVTVAGDIAIEVSKGKDDLKNRLYKLFQDYIS